MSRKLKYILNGGGLNTHTNLDSPFTIFPLPNSPQTVELVVEDEGVDSSVSNSMTGTPGPYTGELLPPIITDLSAHHIDGVTVSFTIPAGGLSYDDVEVRLYNTSGLPDISLSDLPSERVNLTLVDGLIVSGSFTVLPGDGAGMGSANSPGEYTISGGYILNPGVSVNVRIRGYVGGTSSGRTSQTTVIDGDIPIPNYIEVASKTSSPFQSTGVNEFFFTDVTGVFQVGGSTRIMYNRRHIVDDREENRLYYIESSTPLTGGWSTPQEINFTNVRTGRSATGNPSGRYITSNQNSGNPRLSYTIEDIKYYPRSGENPWKGIVTLGDTTETPNSSGIYPEHMYALTSSDGVSWTVLHPIIDDWKFDGNFSLVFDPNMDRYRVYGRIRGESGNGGWGSSNLPYLDRRGVSVHVSRNEKWEDSSNSNWTDNRNLIDPYAVFNNYSTPTQLETNILQWAGSDASDFNPSVLTHVELFDLYQNNVFYDEDLGLFRNWVIVFHRTDERWTWRGGDNESGFDFDEPWTQPLSRFDGRSRYRPVGPWYPVEMTSQDGENWNFTNLSRNDLGLIPGVSNIDMIRREVPQRSPYSQTSQPPNWRPSDNPEPYMLEISSGYVEIDGKKYCAVVDSGRQYTFIPTTEPITSKLYLVEIDSSVDPDPDPGPLPTPTITGVQGGENQLIINGNLS